MPVPALIAVMVLPASTPEVSTATGTFEFVVLLLPSCPADQALQPHDPARLVTGAVAPGTASCPREELPAATADAGLSVSITRHTPH